MRRKPGTLVPLELAICTTALEMARRNVAEFYGYQIAQHLAADASRRFLTAYGTLYRALARLESMGLLVSRREDPAVAARENRPGRRLYALTPAGEDAAERARRAAQQKRRAARSRLRTVPA